MMKVSEAITKMISFSEGNQHDICHFLKVWGFARTIGEAESLDERTLIIPVYRMGFILGSYWEKDDRQQCGCSDMMSHGE